MNDLSGVRQDVLGSAAGVSRPGALGRRLRFYSRASTMTSLATVEIPLFAIIVAIVGISASVAPNMNVRGTGIHLPVLFCPFYALTDFPCLFCGLTRSFLAMGGLDIRQAFIFHPLGPALYLAMLGVGVALAWSIGRRTQLRISVEAALRKNLIRLGAGVVVLAWVLKLAIWNQAGLL